jgi:hypothetical protein
MVGHRQSELERENGIPARIHLLQKDGLRNRGTYFPYTLDIRAFRQYINITLIPVLFEIIMYYACWS